MMIRAGHALAEARRLPALGGRVGRVVPDWGTVAARIRAEATDTWDDRVAVDRSTGKGGIFVRGAGQVVSPIEISAGGTRYAVLGGGAIGCELSQEMARFGVEVTLAKAAPRLLALEEPEAGTILADVLRREGIRVHTGVAGQQQVRADGTGVAVTLADGSTANAERLLVATGRQADPAAVGLGSVGVAADARVAPVDERCRVTPRVWAVRDVTGKGAFTHVAMYQANVVIRDILGEDGPPASYRALPRVTFTDPEVGAVELTEAQPREQLTHVRVGSTQVASTARGWIHKEGNDGVIKVVEDADRGVLDGATAMGPSGGEVLGALAVAVHTRVPVDQLTSMIYAYPTFHRGIEDALGALR